MFPEARLESYNADNIYSEELTDSDIIHLKHKQPNVGVLCYRKPTLRTK